MALSNWIIKTRHKLIRVYLQIIGEPSYKSRADYWPWVKVQPSGPSRYSIYYRNRLVGTSLPFANFNQIKGDIAIIGSGPSVNLMRLDQISKLNCILLNGSISLVDSRDIEPLASVIVDSTFVENRFEMLECLPLGSRLILTPGVARAISERDPKFLMKMNVYLTQNIRKPAYDPGPKYQEQRNKAEQARFSFDLDCGYFDAGTVMAVAMQLAYQIGPRNTYLVGFDVGNAASPRFYETGKNKLKCGLGRDYERGILPFMQSASATFVNAGLNIYNCSPRTKLPYDIIPYCGDFLSSLDLVDLGLDARI